MTTFQDPPPSRRTVRRSEHAEVDAPVRPATARTGRRAQLPSATEWPSDGSTDSATSSMPPTSPAVAETITLASPMRPEMASYDISSVEPTLATAPAKPAPQGRRVSLPTGEAVPTTVVAETTGSVEPELTAPAELESVGVSPAVSSGDTPSVAESSAPPTPAGAPTPAASDEPERPLTRRELRERRVAAERAAQIGVPEAIGAILNSGPIILPYLSAPAKTQTDEVLAEVAEDLTTDDTVIDAEIVEDDLPTDDVQEDAVSAEASATSDSSLISVVPVFIEPSPTPASTRSAGHWSVRPDMDEDIESLENTITRTVGAGTSATTNALVLPSIPQSSDLITPFTATGEIMVTGSIDLPRSLGSTGVHPSRVDTSDFEVDPMDREVLSTDSAPVRAIRAVSTHTSSNGLITSRKPQNNRMLTVLVISASGMAVGVAALLFTGYALQLFP